MEITVDKNQRNSFIERNCEKVTKELKDKTLSFISLKIQYDLSIKKERTGGSFQIKDFEKHIGNTPAVLLGGPGTGKSTLLLKWFTLLAKKDEIIPVFIHCGLMKHYDDLKEVVHLTGFSKDEQEYFWKKGKLYIIFDGINETEEKDTSDFLKDILYLAEIYPNCRYIMSCRSLEFPFWATTFFERYNVTDVTDLQIREQFLKGLGIKLGEKYYDELKYKAQNYLLELCRNPLLLSLVIQIIKKNVDINDDFSLMDIKGKSDIYQKFCRKLIEHQLKKIVRKDSLIFNKFCDEIFCTLSFYMQGNSKVYIKENELEIIIRNMPYFGDQIGDYIATHFGKKVWYEVLGNEVKRSSFINVVDAEEPENKSLCFIHQSFQEYYAGYYMSMKEHLKDSKYIDYLLKMKTRRNWDAIKFASGLDASSQIIRHIMHFAVMEEDINALLLGSECVLENEYARKNAQLVSDYCIWMLDAFKYWDTPYKYELIYAAKDMVLYVGENFPERLKEDIAYFAQKYSDNHPLAKYPESIDFMQLQEIIQNEDESCKLNAIHTLGTRNWSSEEINLVCDYLFSVLSSDTSTSLSEQVVKAIKSLIENNKGIHIKNSCFQMLLRIVCDKNESPRLRTYSLNTLANIGEQSAIKIFMNYLSDKSNPYRDSASWSLQELVINARDKQYDDTYMQAFYYQCLINESADQTGKYAKGNLVYTLGKLNAKPYIDKIKQWLDTQMEAYVQEDGINAIGCLSDKDDIPYLLVYTKSKDPIVQAKAYYGMYRAGYDFTEEDLRTIQNSKYSIVKCIVEKYIRPAKHDSTIGLDNLMRLNPNNNVILDTTQHYNNATTVINIQKRGN